MLDSDTSSDSVGWREDVYRNITDLRTCQLTENRMTASSLITSADNRGDENVVKPIRPIKPNFYDAERWQS